MMPFFNEVGVEPLASACPLIPSDDQSELLEYIDYLCSEDLEDLYFIGSDEEAKRHLMGPKRALLVRRDRYDLTALNILVRYKDTTYKEFCYRVRATTDPEAASGYLIEGPRISCESGTKITFYSGINLVKYLDVVRKQLLRCVENEEIALVISELLHRPKEFGATQAKLPLHRVNDKNEDYVTFVQIEQDAVSGFKMRGLAGQSTKSGMFTICSAQTALTYLSCLQKEQLPKVHTKNDLEAGLALKILSTQKVLVVDEIENSQITGCGALA